MPDPKQPDETQEEETPEEQRSPEYNKEYSGVGGEELLPDAEETEEGTEEKKA